MLEIIKDWVEFLFWCNLLILNIMLMGICVCYSIIITDKFKKGLEKVRENK